MLKAFGKTLFLLFSVTVLVVLFTYAWKDATKPSVEVEPGFTITTTTEPIATIEETTTEDALDTTVASESEVVATHNNEQQEEKSLSETTKEEETAVEIETVVWAEEENTSLESTDAKENGDA